MAAMHAKMAHARWEAAWMRALERANEEARVIIAPMLRDIEAIAENRRPGRLATVRQDIAPRLAQCYSQATMDALGVMLNTAEAEARAAVARPLNANARPFMAPGRVRVLKKERAPTTGSWRAAP